MPATSTNTNHDLEMPPPVTVKQKYDQKGFSGGGVAHPVSIPVLGMSAPNVLVLQLSERGAGQAHMFRQEERMDTVPLTQLSRL